MEIQVKNEQDEKTTEFLSKLSIYEDHLEKMMNKETKLQTLALQVKNSQYEKITELSSKLSNDDYSLEKMSTNETQVQPMSLHTT